MNMLALSTVTKKALIIFEKQGEVFSRKFDSNCKYSERLLLEIDNLLQQAKCEVTQIEKVALLIGPGSFTGIRISTALVKGLFANDDNVKIYPLSTLDFMAFIHKEKNQPKSNFFTVMNALSGRYFVCEYDEKGNSVSKEKMIYAEELDKIEKEKVFLKEEIETGGVEFCCESFLKFAKFKIAQNNFEKARDITPIYIRKSQAEENLNN